MSGFYGIEWKPSIDLDLDPDAACHTTCARHPAIPDRDDPGIAYCTHCGACVGKSAKPAVSFHTQLEQAAIDRLGPFGHPTGQPAPVGRGLVDEFGVTIPTTEGAA